MPGNPLKLTQKTLKRDIEERNVHFCIFAPMVGTEIGKSI